MMISMLMTISGRSTMNESKPVLRIASFTSEDVAISKVLPFVPVCDQLVFRGLVDNLLRGHSEGGRRVLCLLMTKYVTIVETNGN